MFLAISNACTAEDKPPDPRTQIEYDSAASTGYAAARMPGPVGAPLNYPSSLVGASTNFACMRPGCYAVAQRVFEELASRLPGYCPRSMLDWGAGPGTAIWAALEVYTLLYRSRVVCPLHYSRHQMFHLQMLSRAFLAREFGSSWTDSGLAAAECCPALVFLAVWQPSHNQIHGLVIHV